MFELDVSRFKVPTPTLISTTQTLNSRHHRMTDLAQHLARPCHQLGVHTGLWSIACQVRYPRVFRPSYVKAAG